MTLAIFDLDNTLLAGDSDHAFGDFLIEAGLVDPIQHKLRNDQFYHQYQTGGLNIVEYTEFAIGPVKGMGRAERAALHDCFMQRFIEPMMLPAALQLLAQHRNAGDFCLLMTATNRFVTEPIAKRLAVDDLIATELEQKNGLYTGRVCGIPNFQTGKVDNLQQWLAQKNRNGASFGLGDSVFYSDSFNDLPLLEVAGRAVAVDPDQALRDIALARGWEIISLR